MVVAYFLDPIVARLQRLGLSRTWATTTVTDPGRRCSRVGVAMAILPPLFGEVQSLIAQGAAIHRAGGGARAAADRAAAREARPADRSACRTCRPKPRNGPARRLPSSAAWPAALAQRGVAFINLLALVFLTPVVTFYLLRDWEKLIGRDRRRPAARPCRHDPQARARVERRHRGLRARPGAGLHRAGLDLRHRPVAGRAAVRPGHRPDRRRHLLHPLRRHLRRRRHGARHGAGAVSAGLAGRRQGRARCSCSASRWKATCCRPSWSAIASACIRSGSCSPCWPAARCSASSAS